MKKYIADTNFILRYLLADNESHYNHTKMLFEEARNGACQIIIEQCVFTEVVFVLSSLYEKPKEKIVEHLKSLLSYKGIKAELEIYQAALDIYLKNSIHIVDAILAVYTLSSPSVINHFFV